MVAAPAKEMQSSMKSKIVFPEPEGSWLREDKSWSLIGLSSCKWRLQILSCISLKIINLIGWNGAILIGWEDANEETAVQLPLDGESLRAIGWNIIPAQKAGAPAEAYSRGL